MNKLWRWNVHGLISLLPFTLLYAVACWIVYGARSWGVRNNVLICIATDQKLSKRFPGTGGQTIGGCTVFDDSKQELRDDLHVHENGHIVQQMICAMITQVLTPIVFAFVGWDWRLGAAIGPFLGTPLWGIIYGSIFAYYYTQHVGDWRAAYHKNPLEEQCYTAQKRFIEADAATRAKVWK